MNASVPLVEAHYLTISNHFLNIFTKMRDNYLVSNWSLLESALIANPLQVTVVFVLKRHKVNQVSETVCWHPD